MSPTLASCSGCPGLSGAMTFLPIGVSGGLGTSGGTGGAQPPVDDLGLVDGVAVVVLGGQAGCLADGAVDVGDGAAGAAHQVVVVVADPRLVAGDRAGRLD